MAEQQQPLVSIIIPIRNADKWLIECFDSILQQTYRVLEISIYDDGSTDGSLDIILKYLTVFEANGFKTCFSRNEDRIKQEQSTNLGVKVKKGPGYAKNQAVKQCHGQYLCFLDADDAMFPQRVELQLEAALNHPNTLIEVAILFANRLKPHLVTQIGAIDSPKGIFICNNTVNAQLFSPLGSLRRLFLKRLEGMMKQVPELQKI